MRRSQTKGRNLVDETPSRTVKGVAAADNYKQMDQEEESTSATTFEGNVEEIPRPLTLLAEEDDTSESQSESPKNVFANHEIETGHGPQKLTEEEYQGPFDIEDSPSLRSLAFVKMDAYPMPSKSNEMMVPIAPGMNARLRGADETWECIEHDFYLPTSCFACSQDICVIMDADFVICPTCRVVSPVGEDDNAFSPDSSHDTRGMTVGLGFTFEDLAKWQEEIVVKRNSRMMYSS